MSGINPIGNGFNINNQPGIPVLKSIPIPPPSTRATDRLELCGQSHLLTALRSNEVRAGKVAIIKSQIEAGTYETPEKLDVASDRLLDEILR
jgi:hypothetical protein